MKDLPMNLTVFVIAIVSLLTAIGPSKLAANHNQTTLRG